MNSKTIVVTVNDVQKKIAEILKNKGLSVISTERFDNNVKEYIDDCKNIILPFPSKQDKLTFIEHDKSLGDYITAGHLVIGGLFSEEITKDIENSGAEYADYFKNEPYVLKNAFITSQGAVRLLLDTTDDFIVGKKALIMGFGRIGKSLAYMLKALGVKVFVAARSEKALVEASVSGYDVFKISQMYGTLFYYDYIFNTVPEIILEKTHVRRIRADAYYFELASYPFGADKSDFDAEERRYINASALPGRYFPAAVAENICDYMFHRGGE